MYIYIHIYSKVILQTIAKLGSATSISLSKLITLTLREVQIHPFQKGLANLTDWHMFHSKRRARMVRFNHDSTGLVDFW